MITQNSILKIAKMPKKISAVLVALFVLATTLSLVPVAEVTAASTGRIAICKVLLDGQDNFVDGTGLPQGSFSINLADDKNIDGNIVKTVSWDVNSFDPNIAYLIPGLDTAECHLIRDLPYGTYYYSQENIVGDDWSVVGYNDQFDSEVDTKAAFYNLSNYDSALFNSDNSDDQFRNRASDGAITLNADNSIRMLVLGNRLVEEEVETQPIPGDDDQTPETGATNCVLPDSAGTDNQPIQDGWDSQGSLQDMLDAAGYGSINTVTDQLDTQVWDLATGNDTVTFEVEFIGAWAANRNVFGYYPEGADSFTPLFQTKTGNLTSKYNGVDLATKGDTFSFTLSKAEVADVGFALYSGFGNGDHFFSERLRNENNEDHLVVYKVSDDQFILAFEDLLFNETDHDYNDMVVLVTVSCSGGPSCEVPNFFEEDMEADGKVGEDFNFEVVVSGTETISISASTSTPLPDGLVINQQTITGIPTEAGIFEIELVAGNQCGLDKGQLTITIEKDVQCLLPEFINLETALGTVDEQFVYNLQATGTAPLTFSVATSTPLPAGLDLSGNSITGVPSVSGTTTVQLIVENSCGLGDDYLTIGIAPKPIQCTPADFGEVSDINTQVGEALSYTVPVSGTAPVTLSVDAGTPLPAGLTLSGLDIVGTSTEAGVYDVKLIVENSCGWEDAWIKITVAPEPPQCVAPEITSNLTASATTGEQFSYTMTATGTNPINFTLLDELPEGLNFDDGIISGIPTEFGTFEIDFKAKNECGFDRTTLVLTIERGGGSCIAPNITTETETEGVVGQEFEYVIDATGTPSINFSISSTTPLPTGLELVNGNRIAGTPTIDGVFEVDIIAENSCGSDSVTLEITIGNNQCEILGSQEGWYGQYFDYSIDHPHMQPADWGADYGDPLSDVDSWQADWYDNQYYKFWRVDDNLEFGGSFFPMNDVSGAELINNQNYHFGVHWQAQIIVPVENNYSYVMTSDDDTWFYVNGELVDSIAGVHPPHTASDAVYLTAGVHKVDVFFAERHTGGSTMSFKFHDKGIKVIPFAEQCPLPDDVDLDISKTASVSATTVDSTFSYSIVVTNDSQNDATNVEVTDVLPNTLKLVHYSVTKGAYSTTTGVWTISTLEADETAELTLSVRALETGTVVNTATVVADQNDPNSDNNTASSTVVVSGGGGPNPQCSDDADNDGDELIDEDDPACHTDGDPENPDSYDPDIDNENQAPVITLVGENPITITQGNPFTDPGATAHDQEDGDITDDIVTTGSVDTGVIGSYTITYNVSDSEGLAAVPVTRTVKVVPDDSNSCLLTVVSDTQTLIEGGVGAVATYNENPRWTASIPGATWIWETFFVQNPTQEETVVFTRTFQLNVGVLEASLVVAADNGYTVSINGVSVGSDLGALNYFEEGKDTYDVSSHLIVGENTISFEVTNYALENASATSNPAGLLYKLSITKDTEQCAPQNTPPVITLVGENPIQITVGNPFTDPGATADDAEDGDLTDDIVVTGSVDNNTVGSYEITYNVSDSEGLAATPVTRTVNVVSGGGGGPNPQCSDDADNDGDELIDEDDPACHTDGDPENPDSYDPDIDDENSRPVITLIGDNPITVTQGNPFTDPGATADDEEDGDITDDIVTTGSVNTGIIGFYTITYNVSDSKGLAAVPVTRTVNVVSGGGGGGGGGGNIISYTPPTGQVLSATSCFYLRDFLRIDWDNDRVEVIKLQAFLRSFEGFNNLAINGVFDQATYDAVSAFQLRYFDDILAPWGHEDSTGFVYITTRKKINEIFCQRAFPVTGAQQVEIDAFRTFLGSLSSSGVNLSLDHSSVGENNPSELTIDSTAFGEVSLPEVAGNIGEATSTTATATALVTENNFRNFAAAVLATPTTWSGKLNCALMFLLILALIYVVGTLIANSRAKDNETKITSRSRKIGYFITGVVLALIITILLQVYCVVIPLLLALIILALGYLWYSNRQTPIVNKELDLTHKHED